MAGSNGRTAGTARGSSSPAWAPSPPSATPSRSSGRTRSKASPASTSSRRSTTPPTPSTSPARSRASTPSSTWTGAKPGAWAASASSPSPRTTQALKHAELDLDKTDRDRVGVLIGNGIGSLQDSQEAVRTMDARGGMKIDPFFFPKMLPNMAAAHIALQFGARGYNNTVITACAAGTQAIGDALDLVRSGRVDVVITGGTEAALSRARPLRLRRHPRALHAERPAAEGQPPVRRQARRLRRRRGRGHLRPREPGAREGAQAPRSSPSCAGYGACNDAYHVVAPAEDGSGAMPGDERGPARRGRRAGGRGLHQRARHLDPAERQVGDAGDQEGSSARTPTACRSAPRSR